METERMAEELKVPGLIIVGRWRCLLGCYTFCMPETRISEETRKRVADLWPKILDSIAAGEPIRKTLEAAGISVYVAREFMASTPGLRADWDAAKADSADAYFDRVLEIANNPGDDPQRARVQADMFRWLAGKRNPREYSDKATLDVNVRTVDLTRIINDAQARLEASRQVGNAALLAPIMGLAQRVLDGPESQVID